MGSSNTGGGDSKIREETANDGVVAAGSGVPSASDPPSAGAFSEGEKVLAYHGPRLYEAKVQKVEYRKDEWRYYVHYLGWNKNWDEWVGTDRLMKFTEDNVQKQATLDKKQGADKNPKSGRSTQNKPKNVKMEKEDLRNYGPKGKKQKAQPGVETFYSPGGLGALEVASWLHELKLQIQKEKDIRSLEKLVLVQFPLTLKKQLVDDWEFVTQLGKLVKLPRSPNVDDILKRYLDYRTKKDGMVAESVAEILKGLRCYFDKALLAMLLYKKERQQYHETIGDNVSPSTIYGAEHLLRLFVKLPELLAYVNMEEEALVKLQQKLLDFLKFLQKNQSSFFLSTYDGPKRMDESD